MLLFCMRVECSEKCGNFRFYFREILDDHIPDDRVIDPEITVNDPVAESCHIPPWYVRVF